MLPWRSSVIVLYYKQLVNLACFRPNGALSSLKGWCLFSWGIVRCSDSRPSPNTPACFFKRTFYLVFKYIISSRPNVFTEALAGGELQWSSEGADCPLVCFHTCVVILAWHVESVFTDGVLWVPVTWGLWVESIQDGKQQDGKWQQLII